MSFNSVTVVRPYEQIVQQIQHAIRTGQYPQGSRLPTERVFSEQFGVSRSVVREAIKVLAAQGLVESRQGSGLFVLNNTIQSVSRAFVLSVSPDAESVEHLFEFRLTLEVEAVRLAATRRTADQLAAMEQALGQFPDPEAEVQDWKAFSEADAMLHGAFVQASHNPYLQVAISVVRDMHRDVVALFAEHTGAMHVANLHHVALVQAIAAGDAVAAARAMTEHITYTSSVVRMTLESQ